MGLRRVYRATEDCWVKVDTSRVKSRSWGLQGGYAGGGGYFRLSPGTPPFDGSRGFLKRGDWLEVVSPGGGGFGVPGERSPEQRAQDIRDGISFAE